MPRVCTVCTHEKRQEIDAAIVSGEPIRGIAGRFDVSKSSLERHASSHLPAEVIAAQDADEIERANAVLKASNKSVADLLENAELLQKAAQHILSRTFDGGSYTAALGAIREARECLRLQGELLGELDKRPQIGIVIASPEWAAVRTAILAALGPYPDARQAVVKALGNGHSQ